MSFDTRMASIDFLSAGPRPWAGYVLFTVCGALCLLLALAWWQRAGDAARLSALLARAQQQATSPRAPSGPAPQQAALESARTARAQRVQLELLRPWSGLLEAISSAHAPPVQLLAIEPDAKTGKVQISGTAPGFADATAYLRRLQETPLTQVLLATYLRPAEPPNGPLHFTITAQWHLPNLPTRDDEPSDAPALARADNAPIEGGR